MKRLKLTKVIASTLIAVSIMALNPIRVNAEEKVVDVIQTTPPQVSVTTKNSVKINKSKLKLNITPNKQQTDHWCWAASGKTIIDYLNPSAGHPSQKSIVEKVKGKDDGKGANPSGIAKMLKTYGLQFNSTSTISFNTIKDNIKGWYSPILISVDYKSNNWLVKIGAEPPISHAVVIFGFYEDSDNNQIVYCMDPADGKEYNMQYSELKSNNRFTWNKTWDYIKKK